MNKSNLQFQIEDSNPENNPNYGGVLARYLPRQNGTPEQFEALASAFRRNGIPAEYNAELQANLNKKCLPNPSKLVNTFKKASIVLLILGFSMASMAQSKPSPKTNIIVASQGLKATLTQADTTYLNRVIPSVKAVFSNYRSGGTIKNDAADMILNLLKNRK